MKKNHFYIAVCILGLISVQGSCRRDNPDLPFTESGDSTYIHSIVGYDSAVFHIDTVIRIYFTYDNDKRINTVREEIYQSNTTNLSYAVDYRYEYTGADTLPKKVFTKWINHLGTAIPSYDTAFLTYDNDIIVKDSASIGGAVGGFYYYVINLTRTANQLYRFEGRDHDPSQNIWVSRRLFVNWVNGNLVQEIDSNYHAATNTWYMNTANYQYDNHPNPLRRAMFRFPSHNFRRSVNPFTAMGPHLLSAYWLNTTNNVTRDEYSAINPQVVNWTYTYRANGFPRTALRHYVNSYRKFLFHYTDL